MKSITIADPFGKPKVIEFSDNSASVSFPGAQAWPSEDFIRSGVVIHSWKVNEQLFQSVTEFIQKLNYDRSGTNFGSYNRYMDYITAEIQTPEDGAHPVFPEIPEEDIHAPSF